MTGGLGLGRAYDHIKAFGFTLFPHQRGICTEGLMGPTCLKYAGKNTALTRTLVHVIALIANVFLLKL